MHYHITILSITHSAENLARGDVGADWRWVPGMYVSCIFSRATSKVIEIPVLEEAQAQAASSADLDALGGEWAALAQEEEDDAETLRAVTQVCMIYR